MSGRRSLAGDELYAESAGAGEPLVLLHGWAMNLRVFDALSATLAARYHVTAFDLPGHGRSPWPSDWACGGALEEQLGLIGGQLPRDATLIGWSLGGQLALALAADPAHAVRGLVLIASTPCFVRSPEWPHGLPSETLERFAQAVERDPGGAVADFVELQVRGSRNAAASAATLRAALAQHGMAQSVALRAGLGLLLRNDLRVRARAVRAPVLLIAGRYDRVTPAAAAQALARLLPQAQLHELPRAGHAPFLSHPEQVGNAVQSFLRRETHI